MPDIPFWNKCNNHCLMCANEPCFSEASPARYGLKEQINRFERYLSGTKSAYAKNSDNLLALNLTGGEPTLHPEFMKLLTYYRKKTRGLELTLLSNGRRFADPVFAPAAIQAAAAPFVFIVPLHAATARMHDGITGVAGSLKATLSGLHNLFKLKRAGQKVEIRIVLHRKNIRGLKKLLLFTLKEFGEYKNWRLIILHYESDGIAVINRKILALKLETSAAALNKTQKILTRFRESGIYHIPLCLLSSRLRGHARISLPPEDRLYSAECEMCMHIKQCPGIMRQYFGSAKIIPIKKHSSHKA